MIEQTKLAKIVETTNVSFDPATLSEYSQDMSFVPKVRPKCVVKPDNVNEIQAIVQLANQTKTPVIPISSGSPHFRGDTVPSIGGSIIVDLNRMKKILHVNRKHRVAMFEPGTTFGELIEAVGKKGLRLNMPLLPRKTKSVLGSLLEREPVIMPKYHWDIADPLACTEIVFGTGEISRTGAAAGSGTIEEQWAAGGGQKEAAGPSSASWYRVIQGSQGTMGIVTWASARCEIIPILEEPYFAGSSRLSKLMEALHWLIRLRLVNECFILDSGNMAAMLTDSKEEYSELKALLPPWILFFNIAAYDYFPEARLRGQTKDMLDLMQRTSLSVQKTIAGIKAFNFLKFVNQPSPDPYWKIRRKSCCQDIFFLTQNNKLEKMVLTMHQVADSMGYPSSDIGVYVQPIVQGVNCHCEFNLPYEMDNPQEVTRMRQLHLAAVKQLIAEGAFFSRPYGEITQFIMNRDAATVKALQKVKAITDPNNIMNPGKLCF